MKTTNFKNTLLTVFNSTLLMFFVSCVGTIENTKPDTTKAEILKTVELAFSGVSKCTAISQSRVDIKFAPGTVVKGAVDPHDLSYQVYKNGNLNSPVASMKAESTYVDPMGYYHIVVDGLQFNTTYSFSAKILDSKTGISDANSASCSVQTLGMDVPGFNGIIEVLPAAGVEGKNAVVLHWNSATPSSYFAGQLSYAEDKVASYDIFMATTAAQAKPETMTTVATIQEPAPPLLPVTSYKVPNLNPGSTYYFMVRARDGREGGRVELNEIIKSGTTIRLTENSVAFTGIETLTVPTDASGFSTLHATWRPAQGIFDRYNIYVIPETAEYFFNKPISQTSPLDIEGSEDITDVNYIKKYLWKSLEGTDLSLNSIDIRGLSAGIKYKVLVVACAYVESYGGCKKDPTTTKGNGIVKTATPEPPLAPFGGIASIDQPVGQMGLTQLNINWYPPNLAKGVCSQIEVFSVPYDSTDITLPTPLPPCGVVTGACNATGSSCSLDMITVNMPQGFNVTNTDQSPLCFKARVRNDIGSAMAMEQPYDSMQKMCGLPKYTVPVFAGISTTQGCESMPGGQAIKIQWPYPESKGIFDDFVVFQKPVVDNERLSGDAFKKLALDVYQKKTIDPTLTYKMASNLTQELLMPTEPGKTYYFMVNTVFNLGGGLGYAFDLNNTMLGCTAEPLQVYTGGWEGVMSIGPRINGMMDTLSPTKVNAPYVWNGTSTTYKSDYNWDSLDITSPAISYPTRGVMAETLVKETAASDGLIASAHYYPRTLFMSETQPTPPDNSSQEGIVQISWKDFVVPTSKGNLTMTEYLDGKGHYTGEGYWVYRFTSVPNGATVEERLKNLNSLAMMNQPINKEAIIIDGANPVGIYTDYINKNLHSVLDQGDSPLTDAQFREGANKGRVVWYAVFYKRGSEVLGFIPSAKNTDAFIPVIIPPANMASIHHWMANQYTCNLMKKDVDRENQYRCDHSGLGEVEVVDPNTNVHKQYYDIGGHVLVDRWHLGCNISRYLDEHKCLNKNTTAVYDKTSTTEKTPRQVHQGDCVVSADVSGNDYPSGKIGESVAYNTWLQSCMLKTTLSTTAAPLSDEKNGWAAIISSGENLNGWNIAQSVPDGNLPQIFAEDSDNLKNIKKGLIETSSMTATPPYIPDSYGNKYTQNQDSATQGPKAASTLRGYGARISSNDSNLPPLTNVTASQGYYLCQSHAIQIANGETKISKKIRKRMLSSRENYLASAPGQFISTNNHLGYIERSSDASSENPMDGGAYDANSTRSTCQTARRSRTTTTQFAGYPWYQSYPFTSNWNMISGHLGNNAAACNGDYCWTDISIYNNLLSTGNFSKFGTQRCVSRFGVQDYVGSINTLLQDTVLCDPTQDGGLCKVATDKTKDASMIDTFKASYGNLSWPIIPLIDKQSYMNGAGNAFQWNMKEIDNTLNGHFGYPRIILSAPLSVTASNNTTSLAFTGAYVRKIASYDFSHVIGQPLLCMRTDTGCTTDDKGGLRNVHDNVTFVNQFTGEYLSKNLPPSPLTNTSLHLADSFFVVQQIDPSQQSVSAMVLTLQGKGAANVGALSDSGFYNPKVPPTTNSVIDRITTQYQLNDSGDRVGSPINISNDDSRNFVAPFSYPLTPDKFAELIIPNKLIHRAGTHWRNTVLGHDKETGVRCAVKIKLDVEGDVEEIDGENIQDQ